MTQGNVRMTSDTPDRLVGQSTGHEEHVFHALLRTSAVLSNEADRVIRPWNLSLATYMVLRSLRSAGPKGRSASAIVENMTARVPDVTRLVDRLEKANLVQRSRAESDRRIVLVCITAKGERLLTEAEPLLSSLLERLLGHLGRDDLACLADLLNLVLSNSVVLAGAK